MQTFLPHRSFILTARCLDQQRLGNQRNEAKVILKTLLYGGGWENHPAVRMWRGFEEFLCVYGITICKAWRLRGYRDQQLEYFKEFFYKLHKANEFSLPPPWLGDEEFHASHRSNLLRKDPEHYKQFNWVETPDLPYVWPVRSES